MIKLRKLLHRVRNRIAELFGEERTETCDLCGRRILQVWHTPDNIWLAVNGSPYGCLCIDCFNNKAGELSYFLDWSCKDRKF